MSNSKSIIYLVMAASGAFLMLQFQNCSQTKFSKSFDANASKAASTQDVSINPVVPPNAGETRVIVTDRDNNIVLVEREEVPVMVPVLDRNIISDLPEKDPIKVQDPVPVKDTDTVVAINEEIPDQTKALSCIEMSKQYKSHIDISKLTDGKISYLRGKNFLYSSTGYSKFDNVEIDNANGRTILCGVHIGLIKMKVGRLELIRSTVDVIENQKGVIRQDSDSRILQLK